MTTVEINEYEVKLRRIADEINEANRDKPASEVATIIEQRMNTLTAVSRDAVLKIASQVDFVGAQEFAELTNDEAIAWDLIVTKVRCSGVV